MLFTLTKCQINMLKYRSNLYKEHFEFQIVDTDKVDCTVKPICCILNFHGLLREVTHERLCLRSWLHAFKINLYDDHEQNPPYCIIEWRHVWGNSPTFALKIVTADKNLGCFRSFSAVPKVAESGEYWRGWLRFRNLNMYFTCNRCRLLKFLRSFTFLWRHFLYRCNFRFLLFSLVYLLLGNWQLWLT